MNLLKLLLVSEIIDGDYGGGSGDRPMPSFSEFIRRRRTEEVNVRNAGDDPPTRPDPPPAPQPVNLFHDVFREDQPSPNTVIIKFERLKLFLKVYVLVGIAFIVSITAGSILLNKPISLVRLDNVTITDKETGEKFIEFFKDYEEFVKIDAININAKTVFVRNDEIH